MDLTVSNEDHRHNLISSLAIPIMYLKVEGEEEMRIQISSLQFLFKPMTNAITRLLLRVRIDNAIVF